MKRTITLVESDSTGKQALDDLEGLLHAAGAGLTFERYDASDGEATDELVAAIRSTGVALMGFQWGRREDAELPPVVRLRKQLGIHTNLRPVRSLPGVDSIWDDLDLLLVRETTEDVYAHLEHESLPGVFESLKVTTKAACERVSRAAFELARAHGRKKVTTVHKSNIMKLSDGLLLRTSREVAADYPEIVHDEVIVDACCMKLVVWPKQFDVLLCGNLFGNIVADLCAGLVGGPVNTPSINLGEGVALFTIGHRGPTMEATDPFPLLLSSLYMLEHVGERGARARLGAALEGAVLAGVRPESLGGEADSASFTAAVRERL